MCCDAGYVHCSVIEIRTIDIGWLAISVRFGQNSWTYDRGNGHHALHRAPSPTGNGSQLVWEDLGRKNNRHHARYCIAHLVIPGRRSREGLQVRILAIIWL